MSQGFSISLHQQLSAALEVLNHRRAGYPKQVAAGKIRQAEADFRIAQFDAITDTLAILAQASPRDGAGLPETLVRAAFVHFTKDAEHPCGPSAMRETLALVFGRLIGASAQEVA